MKKAELEKVIFLDFETTGLNAVDDDIISVAVLNGLGNLLFLRYCSTQKKKFIDAELVNGLNYNLLVKCRTFYKFKTELQKIINASDRVVLWCCGFDLPFLKKYKIKIDDKKITCLQKLWCLQNNRDLEFAPSLETLALSYDCGYFDTRDIISKLQAQIKIFKKVVKKIEK